MLLATGLGARRNAMLPAPLAWATIVIGASLLTPLGFFGFILVALGFGLPHGSEPCLEVTCRSLLARSMSSSRSPARGSNGRDSGTPEHPESPPALIESGGTLPDRRRLSYYARRRGVEEARSIPSRVPLRFIESGGYPFPWRADTFSSNGYRCRRQLGAQLVHLRHRAAPGDGKPRDAVGSDAEEHAEQEQDARRHVGRSTAGRNQLLECD